MVGPSRSTLAGSGDFYDPRRILLFSVVAGAHAYIKLNPPVSSPTVGDGGAQQKGINLFGVRVCKIIVGVVKMSREVYKYIYFDIEQNRYEFEYADQPHSALLDDLYSEFFMKQIPIDMRRARTNILVKNPAITIHTIEKYPSIFHKYRLLVFRTNPNITEAFARKVLDEYGAKRCSDCTFSHEAPILSAKEFVTPDFMKEYHWVKWDLAKNPHITWDSVKNWCLYSTARFFKFNKNVPFIKCTRTMDCIVARCSARLQITTNRHLTKEFITEHIDCFRPVDRCFILMNSNIDEEFISKYIDKFSPRDLTHMAMNPSVGWQFTYNVLKQHAPTFMDANLSILLSNVHMPIDEICTLLRDDASYIDTYYLAFNPSITWDQCKKLHDIAAYSDHLLRYSLWGQLPKLSWRDVLTDKYRAWGSSLVLENPMNHQKRVFIRVLSRFAVIIQKWWRGHMYSPVRILSNMYWSRDSIPHCNHIA